MSALCVSKHKDFGNKMLDPKASVKTVMYTQHHRTYTFVIMYRMELTKLCIDYLTVKLLE